MLVVRAHAQTIEHGGDAGRRYLAIVGLNGGHGVPSHAGSRRVMHLEVIGVQFDEAGNEVVTAKIDAASRGSFHDLDDPAVANDRATGDNAILKDELSITDFKIASVGHLRASSHQACARPVSRLRSALEMVSKMNTVPMIRITM